MNFNKPRIAKTTYLVGFEGKTEESLFKILKKYYCSQYVSKNSFRNTKDLKGGSGEAQLLRILNHNEANNVDKILWLTDKDKYDEKNIDKHLSNSNNIWLKEKIIIIVFDPCVEACLLEIKGVDKISYSKEKINTDNLKSICKKEIHKSYVDFDCLCTKIKEQEISDFIKFAKSSHRNTENINRIIKILSESI
jgi:hypothetical protein